MNSSSQISTTFPSAMLDTAPLFSVVIPLYNSEKYVENTIQSVLQQTFEDFEIVVIDDGSTDNSKAIVTSISDRRIQYFYQSNQGVSAARNAGIEHAKGRYIAFLDADDLWHCNFLQSAAAAFASHPEITWYATDSESFSGETNVCPEKLSASYQSKLTILNYFKKGYLSVCSSSVCFRSDSIKNRLFLAKLQHGEDLLFWYEYASQHPLVLIEQTALTFYYKHSGSLTNNSLTVHEYISGFEIFCKCNVTLRPHENIVLQRTALFYLYPILKTANFEEFTAIFKKTHQYLRVDFIIFFYFSYLLKKYRFIFCQKVLARLFCMYLKQTHVIRS